MNRFLKWLLVIGQWIVLQENLQESMLFFSGQTRGLPMDSCIFSERFDRTMVEISLEEMSSKLFKGDLLKMYQPALGGSLRYNL